MDDPTLPAAFGRPVPASGETVPSVRASGPGVELETGAATDPGRKRKGEPNQDAWAVVSGDSAHPPLLIVADGMGGYAGGTEASQVVVQAAAAHYLNRPVAGDLSPLLIECLAQAHKELGDYSKKDSKLDSMGSTAVLAAIDGAQVFVANIGDSRAYLLHGEEMRQISFDHSIVADQVRAGRMTALEALRSPLRNRLTQSITPKRKEVQPFIAGSPFCDGDTLLLCTDGLWGVVTEAIVQMVIEEMAPQAAADKLVALALARGAPDNVTAVIARRRSGSAPPAAESGNSEITLVGLKTLAERQNIPPKRPSLARRIINSLSGIARRGKKTK